MEAFPPGSDQLLSWESHTPLGGRPVPAGVTLHSAARRESTEREKHLLILLLALV